MRRYYLFGLATALTAALTANAAWAQTPPIVVELFTSQGCSSCPPADKLLGELAQRGDVLALGFHVDYWDRLGWRDPLSAPAATERQRAYARHFNGGQIYTPQIVVDGTREMVGNNRTDVLAAIRAAQPPTVAPVMIAPDRRSVTIGAGTGKGSVLLVRFARHRTTQVGAGENSGRTAEDINGVEELHNLGDWSGAAHDFAISPPLAGEGLAVLVQGADGRILGAASVLQAPPTHLQNAGPIQGQPYSNAVPSL